MKWIWLGSTSYFGFVWSFSADELLLLFSTNGFMFYSSFVIANVCHIEYVAEAELILKYFIWRQKIQIVKETK